MYSLVLMATLSTGANAAEGCFFQCDPFPCGVTWWYTCGPWCGPCDPCGSGCGCGPCWGYPWYNSYVSYYCPCPCGPIGPIVIQEQSKEKEKDKEKGKDKDKQKEEMKKKKDEKREKEKDAREAKLLVELPADARLFIDGNLMKSGSTRCGIITPPLQQDQTYYYDVKVELVRHGHTLVETQRIRLIPGELVTANFNNLENRAAAIVRAGRR